MAEFYYFLHYEHDQNFVELINTWDVGNSV